MQVWDTWTGCDLSPTPVSGLLVEQHLKEHGTSPSDVHIVPYAGVAVRDGHDPIPALHELGCAVLGDVMITSLAAAQDDVISSRASGLARAHILDAGIEHALCRVSVGQTRTTAGARWLLNIRSW